jgi:hypothetical protein
MCRRELRGLLPEIEPYLVNSWGRDGKTDVESCASGSETDCETAIANSDRRKFRSWLENGISPEATVSDLAKHIQFLLLNVGQ